MTPAPAEIKPLWPQPIPILGLTGEYNSGKTWFGISICPDPKRLRVYDFELSAAPYRSLGFDYVNMPERMAQKFPRGCKPVDVWNWWLEDVSSLETGRFDAILVDPITDVERGLTDWVGANPQHFGHTSGQYQKMSGIMWGDLKDYWKLILSTRVAVKCQTFAFTAHLGDEFKSNTATGKRAPKGKDTLAELCSLYLWLERRKDANGAVQQVPSAEVIKTRLSHMTMTEDGPAIRPALPPRLPVATPKAIRNYLNNPPDYAKLRPEELAPERVMSDDERLRLKVQLAEAERQTAETIAGIKSSGGTGGGPATEAQEARVAAATAGQATQVAMVTVDQLKEIVKLRDMMFAAKGLVGGTPEATASWADLMTTYSVKSAKEFTEEQANKFIETEGPKNDPFGHPSPANQAQAGPSSTSTSPASAS